MVYDVWRTAPNAEICQIWLTDMHGRSKRTASDAATPSGRKRAKMNILNNRILFSAVNKILITESNKTIFSRLS